MRRRMGGRRQVPAEQRRRVFPRDATDIERADLAAAFDNRSGVDEMALSPASRLVVALVGFVGLDRGRRAAHRRRIADVHRFADAVRHEPKRTCR